MSAGAQVPRAWKAGSGVGKIAAAISTAGSAGLALSHLEAQLGAELGLTRHALNLAANRVVKAGQAWKVGRGLKSDSLRWFALEADAKAYAEQIAITRSSKTAPRQPVSTQQRNDKTLSEVLFKRRIKEQQDAERRAASRAAAASAPPVITARTVITVAPRPVDHRYAFTGPVVGGFASGQIGHYEQPASGWAAAASGGAQHG